MKYETTQSRKFGSHDDKTDEVSSFETFCSTLAPSMYLSPQPPPSAEALALLQAHSDPSSPYNTPPLSLLSLHQRHSSSSSSSSPVFLIPHKPPHLVGLTLEKANLWVGKSEEGECNSSGLHYDYHENILVPLKGYKRVRLIAPEWRDRCYMVAEEEGDFVAEEGEGEEGGGGGDEEDESGEERGTAFWKV